MRSNESRILLVRRGFDYWLDVFSPVLSFPVPPGAQTQLSAFATAAVIEMGLLNSSHVMAVMTPNTMGAQWVPYEYGRVRDPVPITWQAACWPESSLLPSAVPEYLYLGAITNSETDIKKWLLSEYCKFGLPAFKTCHWNRPVPPSL
jgi:hypothetical protein